MHMVQKAHLKPDDILLLIANLLHANGAVFLYILLLHQQRRRVEWKVLAFTHQLIHIRRSTRERVRGKIT